MKLNRYNRQTILKGFGIEGQRKLSEAKILVIGAGGLGVPVLTYLNAMGVGKIGVVDNDVVSLTNLHRQVLYTEADVDRSKVSVAIEKLRSQNSGTELVGYETFLTVSNAMTLISDYDIVVDASDNFPTRYLVNDSCVMLNKPFVYGALHGYEGQVSVFNYHGGPTYRCLFPEMPKEDEVPNCNEHGVLGIIPGIVGSLQALETIKVIAGIGEVLSGRLLLFNGLDQSYQKIKFKTHPENLKLEKLQDFYEWSDPCEVVSTITVNKLQDMMSDGTNFQLIDVRTAAEFDNYHLPKSINIPLDHLEKNLQEIDFKMPVYLICQSGKRSEIALKKLKVIHAETVFYHIFGGVNQYLTACS
ncbi:MAG: ThiF family adenylyltransferase [Flavobacteriaceae bacterium]